MTALKLYQLNEHLEEVISKSESEGAFRQEVSNLQHKHSIENTQKLKAIIESKQSENRLMNIGIVGRVKAGKSSLLNALFFEGEDILPNAATPMTAALTTLSYGESFEAMVEFYSSDDRRIIQKNHDEFEHLLNKKLAERLERYTQKQGKEPTAEDKEKMLQMCKREINNPALSASHDQYERMKKSGLLHEVHDSKVIQADDSQALAQSLLDYVGAEGRYMPFTKSVNIRLPIDSLKDICVVDTPGFNDPVQSREARTVELLHECDVIFIVSPAGQFLSAEDFDMLARITTKEGIQEIVVVASQIDSQFHASEKRDSVRETLDGLKDRLSSRIQTDVATFQKNHPEMGNTFDKLINNSKDNLLYSSGIAYGIAKKLEAGNELSEKEITPWQNLQRSFPNEFSEGDIKTSIASLNNIANIDNIRAILQNVREQKTAIMQKNVDSFVTTKLKNAQDYREDLIKMVDTHIERLNNTDKGELEDDIKFYKTLERKVGMQMDDCFNQLISDLKTKIDKELLDVVRQKFKEVNDQYEGSRLTDSREVKEEKSGVVSKVTRFLRVGGYKYRTEEFSVVYTNQCTNALREFLRAIEDALRKNSHTLRTDFDKKVSQDIMNTYRKAVNDDKLFDEKMALETIKFTQGQFVMPEYQGDVKIPSNLEGRGKLTGYDADEYLRGIEKFTANTYDDFRAKITDYQKQVDGKLREQGRGKTFGDKFTQNFSKAYTDLNAQLEFLVISIDRLNTLKQNLQKADM